MQTAYNRTNTSIVQRGRASTRVSAGHRHTNTSTSPSDHASTRVSAIKTSLTLSHNLRLACPALGPSAPFSAYRLAGVASCPGFTGALFRRTPRRARRPRSGVSLGRLRVLPGLPQELGFRRAPRAHDGRVRLLQRIAWLASRLVRTFVRGTGCICAACHVRATRELLPLLLRPPRGAQKRAACSMSESVRSSCTWPPARAGSCSAGAGPSLEVDRDRESATMPVGGIRRR